MARLRPVKDIVHLFILRNGEEDVERWVDEVVDILTKKNIHCLKEEDFIYVGENLFVSLERSINLAENVMVVLTEGFLLKNQSRYRFHLALKQSIERQVPFIPVLSFNVKPPPEIAIRECLWVDFSDGARKDDVEKIERALHQKSVTLSDIEKMLLICEEKLKRAPSALILCLPQIPQFKRICSVFKEINNQNSRQEKNANYFKLEEIRSRTRSDVSGMKNVKKVIEGRKGYKLSVLNHLFILGNGEEEVERWVDEVVDILMKKNIRCVKEDCHFVGENLFVSLQRSINSAENIMVVLSEKFLTNSKNMYKFHLALNQSIERRIPLLPVLSLYMNSPSELDIMKCMRVNFSKSAKKDDVERIIKAIGQESVTLSEIEKCLFLCEEKLRKAPNAVKLDLRMSSLFRRVSSVFKELNNQTSCQERSDSYPRWQEIRRRSKSDASGMKNMKSVRGWGKRNPPVY